MAALGPVQERSGVARRRVWQSPYSVGETVQRIEAEARPQALSVSAELNLEAAVDRFPALATPHAH